jgi:hypothetical protein
MGSFQGYCICSWEVNRQSLAMVELSKAQNRLILESLLIEWDCWIANSVV